ncbi:hypothetical protein ASG11_07860 [Sphingomonas sp. Leaf357]|uniref:hypothetical protein n=1 Tax=Sphingomonas sp. Leaf357 TaxID=1736350 RepID=UPI0006FA8C21|nr:hypothetical protein [Sphingomonas sp. Leaf357]KQS04175.1 hypothetical protein ASG11_07860 [Sphingomonas sp. Leaf357]
MMPRGRARLYGLIAASLSAVPGVALAQSDIRVSADASANIGYSNNPFSETGNDTSSGVADIQITPVVSLVNERSVFTLSGYAQYQQYFRRYDNAQNYSAALNYNGTPTEHITTHLGASFDNSIVGSNNGLNGAFDPTDPTPPPVTGSDLSLFGTRDRRRTFRTDGDATFILSPRDTLTTSAYYVSTRFKNFGLFGDYDGYGGTAAYSRQISDHLQLGGQGSIAKYDYKGPQGDSTIYSVRGSFSTDFGPRWKADGALGVSFVKDASRGGTNSTLSGNLNLCRVAERANLCIKASRSVVPTGVSGTQTETAIGANYSYKLSERGTLFANADYVRNGSNQLLLPGLTGRNQYLNASIGYERYVRERVRIITTGRYRDVYGANGNRAADYGGQIGVAIKFGDKK